MRGVAKTLAEGCGQDEGRGQSEARGQSRGLR